MDLCLTLLYWDHGLASLPNPSNVQIHSFSLFWPIFDQKGSRWGFLRLRNRFEPLTIRKSHKRYGKNEKNGIFLLKIDIIKYSPGLGCSYWRWGSNQNHKLGLKLAIFEIIWILWNITFKSEIKFWVVDFMIHVD